MSSAAAQLSAITIVLEVLTATLAHDVVILYDSREGVLRLASQASSDPTTSLALRHAAVYLGRHRNISISWIQTDTSISGNRRAGEEADEEDDGTVEIFPDAIGTCRALHSVLRLTAEEA